MVFFSAAVAALPILVLGLADDSSSLILASCEGQKSLRNVLSPSPGLAQPGMNNYGQ